MANSKSSTKRGGERSIRRDTTYDAADFDGAPVTSSLTRSSMTLVLCWRKGNSWKGGLREDGPQLDLKYRYKIKKPKGLSAPRR